MNDGIITMAHGGGGLKTKELISGLILKHLGNPLLDGLDDAASFPSPGPELALTTDSFVIKPCFFPGGDIGRLAICGTLNDLVMQAAEPLYLTLGLILEEGVPIADLDRVLASMADALQSAGARIITGDTKVIERRDGNGILINTAGLGRRWPGMDASVKNARPGDKVIITGTIGDHGVAIMSVREGLKFQTALVSDVAPLSGLMRPLFEAALPIRCLRDPTRGGVAAAVCDIAEKSGVGIRLIERDLPVKKEVLAACSLLGLDPLNVANEGKALIICGPGAEKGILESLARHPLGRESRVIGEVTGTHPGMAVLRTVVGGERIIHVPAGEDLPRIC